MRSSVVFRSLRAGGACGSSRPHSLAIIVVLGLAACQFHAGAASDGGGGSGGDADGPPMVDAPVDVVVTPVDLDGDGVLNAADNCPTTFNPDQHNEDADVDGDKCDPCPQVANQDITNSDGDLLPDVCDPHPNADGDELLYFEGFAGTTLPAGWVIKAGVAGDFVVGGDNLAMSSTTPGHLITYDTTKGNHAIDVGVDVPAATGTTSFSVLTAVQDDISHFFGCGVRIDVPSREFYSYVTGTFTDLDTDPQANPAPTFPGPYRVIGVQAANREECAVPDLAMLHKMVGTTSSGARTNVGLRVYHMTAVVHYVAIYTF